MTKLKWDFYTELKLSYANNWLLMNSLNSYPKKVGQKQLLCHRILQYMRKITMSFVETTKKWTKNRKIAILASLE